MFLLCFLLQVYNFAFHIWVFNSSDIDFCLLCEIRICFPLPLIWVISVPTLPLTRHHPFPPTVTSVTHEASNRLGLVWGSVLGCRFICLSPSQSYTVLITLIHTMSGYPVGYVILPCSLKPACLFRVLALPQQFQDQFVRL